MAQESSPPPAPPLQSPPPPPITHPDLPPPIPDESHPSAQEDPPPPSQESKSLAAMMDKEEESLLPPPPPLPSSAAEDPPLIQVTSKSVPSSEDVAVVESSKDKEEPIIKAGGPLSLVSFKEESNKLDDLSDFETRAFQEFKFLVQEALNNHQFTAPSESNVETAKKEEEEEEVSIWGIPLLKDDRSDVILLKFLRARDFKVKDAFVMLKNTLRWRKEFKIDELIEQDLGDDLEKIVFMHGSDKDGHAVCYNVFGEFQNKELYQKTFADEEKRANFLRWRIQFLERSIRKLDFSPGGFSTIFQVNDLKNSPGPGKKELRLATKQALELLQDNYPEFVAKQVFINAPWWYLAFYAMMSPFMTQRTKNKFVFASSAKSAETLFKYIAPEHVPVQYGGLGLDYCDCNPDFTVDDPATQLTVKPATKQIVEIIIYEKCIITWEIRVVGWEVSYGSEFVPNDKTAYTIIIQKPTKMASTDEPVITQSFKVGELGKILLTIDNPTSKKKTLLYRFNIKPLAE